MFGNLSNIVASVTDVHPGRSRRHGIAEILESGEFGGVAERGGSDLHRLLTIRA